MRYEGTVYRPPSEAGSLLIQTTIGCPHNKCRFCGMYKDKRFRIRKLADIMEDLTEAEDQWQKWKDDPLRKSYEDKMEGLLLEPPRFEVFAFGTLPFR